MDIVNEMTNKMTSGTANEMINETENGMVNMIAYYEENNYHTEILGTFVEYFHNNGVHLTIFNDGDKSEFILYYKKYFNFEVKKTGELMNEYNKYKYIIMGTGDETTKLNIIYESIREKIVPIYHILSNINVHIYQKNIVLTPLNIVNKSNQYILPIYNVNCGARNIEVKNIFALIGRFKDNNRDTTELIELVEKNRSDDYEIHLYIRNKKFIPNSLMNLSKKYPKNLKISIGVKTIELEKRLMKTKFMISLISYDSCYHKDRLSGIIPLAYNFNIPLLIDDITNNIYGLKSSIVYKKSINEIFSKLLEINHDEYKVIINNMLTEKNKIIKNNNIILDSVFK